METAQPLRRTRVTLKNIKNTCGKRKTPPTNYPAIPINPKISRAHLSAALKPGDATPSHRRAGQPVDWPGRDAEFRPAQLTSSLSAGMVTEGDWRQAVAPTRWNPIDSFQVSAPHFIKGGRVNGRGIAGDMARLGRHSAGSPTHCRGAQHPSQASVCSGLLVGGEV